MSFNTKYIITEKILNNLSGIGVAREVIEQACLSPDLEEKLRQRVCLYDLRLQITAGTGEEYGLAYRRQAKACRRAGKYIF